MPDLGVNIDHVATVRQARKTYEPDPVWAASLSELGGADQITVHLREDRRHIQDRDLRLLKETVTVRLNLEIAAESDVVDIALELRPDSVCVVPEKREEVTTEGGLDVAGQLETMRSVVDRCKAAGIFVSMFIDPEPAQIDASADIGVDAVEIHTGCYANAAERHGGISRIVDGMHQLSDPVQQELQKIIAAGKLANERGLLFHSGHGLTYRNVKPIASIPGMRELNIGHSIVGRALMVGFQQAVREMKELIDSAAAAV